MTKIRKYNGVYKLPIHKHTPVRRPKSKWKLWVFPYQPILNKVEGVNYVQDISKGLENPLDARTWEVVFDEWKATHPQQKGDWKEAFRGMSEHDIIKQPLLTKLKNRFKK